MKKYKITFGNGTAWMVEREVIVEDYDNEQSALDKMIDQLEEEGAAGYFIDHCETVEEGGIYEEDTYITGGNHGLNLIHYGNFSIKDMGHVEKFNKYQLINYFDVWGNETEGFEINNQCIEFTDLNISENATDAEIIEYLYNIEFFTSKDVNNFNVDNMGDMIEINSKNGCPLCRLELIEE